MPSNGTPSTMWSTPATLWSIREYHAPLNNGAGQEEHRNGETLEGVLPTDQTSASPWATGNKQLRTISPPLVVPKFQLVGQQWSRGAGAVEIS